jgi:hypothetical protein
MKYAYRVWHSEAHKNAARVATGRPLSLNEIRSEHENLITSLRFHHEADPSFKVNMNLLKPSERGVILMLESEAGADEADAWIARFLVRLNNLDVNLCLIAEPLPRT